MRSLTFTIVMLTIAGGCKKNHRTHRRRRKAEVPTALPASPPPATQAAPAVRSNGERNWPQAEIEDVIRTNVELTQFTLTKAGSERYTGTGQNAAGVHYTFEIYYRPGEIRIDYQHLTSRGDRNNGSYHWVAQGTQKKF